MEDALIVIDMQNDFINGSLGTKEAQNIVPNVREKVLAYQKEKKPIVFTKDTHTEDYLNTFEGKKLPVEHCIMNTKGWEICDELKDLADIPQIITKPTFGYNMWNEYIQSLDTEIKSIEICGLCTDICVITNALVLRTLYPDMPIKVDVSCCAGVTPQLHMSALSVMESCQIDIIF